VDWNGAGGDGNGAGKKWIVDCNFKVETKVSYRILPPSALPPLL